MASKTCIINRDENGNISVNIPNPLHIVNIAISRNNNNPLHLTATGQPSILYQTLIDMKMDPQTAEITVAQTFSDEFGEWFGRWWEGEPSSEVVDKNGQPKIVWSGTNLQTVSQNINQDRFQGIDIIGNEYNNYEKDEENPGEYRFSNTGLFLESMWDASMYAVGVDIRTLRGRSIKTEGIITPVFLNIRNSEKVDSVSHNEVENIPGYLESGRDGMIGMNHASNVGLTYAVANASQVYPIETNIIDTVFDLVETDSSETTTQPENTVSVKDFVNSIQNNDNYKIVKELGTIYALEGPETLEQLESKWKLSVDESRYAEWDAIFKDSVTQEPSDDVMEVQANVNTSSDLFNRLKLIPGITQEQSLEIYKDIYSEQMLFHKDPNLKC